MDFFANLCGFLFIFGSVCYVVSRILQWRASKKSSDQEVVDDGNNS